MRTCVAARVVSAPVARGRRSRAKTTQQLRSRTTTFASDAPLTVKTSVQSRTTRTEGRPVYSPDSYQDICFHAYQSVADGLGDGLRLMEVEFPAVPGEDASYKAASDMYIDLNIQYALTVFSKIHKETGKTCELLVPDGPEYRRAKKIFANSLELSEGCVLNTLDGQKTEAVGSFLGKVFGGKGLRTRTDDVEGEGFGNADIFCVVNLSCVDLPVVERFVNEQLGGRPLVFLNNEVRVYRFPKSRNPGHCLMPRMECSYASLTTTISAPEDKTVSPLIPQNKT